MNPVLNNFMLLCISDTVHRNHKGHLYRSIIIINHRFSICYTTLTCIISNVTFRSKSFIKRKHENTTENIGLQSSSLNGGYKCFDCNISNNIIGIVLIEWKGSSNYLLLFIVNFKIVSF
jgi:hypothetical protein